MKGALLRRRALFVYGLPMNRDFDRLRRFATPLENAVVDELIAGRLGRRDFMRHARRIGMAAPLISALGFSWLAGAEGKGGGAIRGGMTVPSGAINPLTVGDAGGVALLS